MPDTSMRQEAARFEPPARSARSGATGALELEGGPLVRRDLVRWGPVIAGLVCVITTLAILSALGLAIGLSAVEPSGSGLAEISTGAWIWGIASAVVAFFLGGLVAGMSSAWGVAVEGCSTVSSWAPHRSRRRWFWWASAPAPCWARAPLRWGTS